MKIKTIGMLTLVIMLTACQTRKSEEENINRLLERQAQIQEKQESAISDLEKLKDSLSREQESLLEERANKDVEIKKLEGDQATLIEELNRVESEEFSERKQELESRINQYSDSVAMLKKEVEQLNVQLDSLETHLSVYQVQENRTMQRLESGVAEIDSRMKNRETRRQQEVKRVNLLNKRIGVSEKKVEAYQMERQLYVEERDNLLRTNAPDEKLVPFRKRISEMDSIIAKEKKYLSTLQEDKKQAEQYISETDRVMEDLNQQIHDQYDRQEIIESFIGSEKDRLQGELDRISNLREKLMEEQASIATELENINQQMGDLDSDMNLIKTREMSEILEQQASMEKTEADLAREEVNLLQEFKDAVLSPLDMSSDSLGEEMKNVMKLGDEIDSLNALIQEEKAEIAETRQQLSEQRARVTEERARFGKIAGVTMLVIILAGAGLLSLFYVLGKRSGKGK